VYKPDTILALKEPRTEYDEDGAVVGEAFPYDRVRVIGQSPVNHATIATEWTGANGQGVIVEPLTEFGANLDEPFGRLQELYVVESLPEPAVFRGEQVEVLTPADLGPSPEQVFADEAEKEGHDSRRARRFIPQASPLVETPPDPAVEAEKARLKKEAMRRAGKTEEDFDVKGEENGDGQEAD
jgi:hypothetical protein